jgi:L-amino acid N-acyltransferase YncA
MRSRRESHFGEEGPGFLVAEEDGAIIGFAIFGACRDADLAGWGQLNAIYVAPDAWRRGVGASLLDESCARLATLGFERAALWVLRDNLRARRFYEKHGWVLEGAEKERDFGVPVFEVRYQRRL